MIQQRPVIYQTYYDPKMKAKRQRPVRQAARLKLTGKVLVLSQKKSTWGALVGKLFRRRAA